MASDTIAIQFVRAVAHTAQANDIELEMVLADVINPELLGHDLGRVTSEQFVRIVHALWQRTDDELFGLAPRPIPRGTFRMITLGVIHTPDLGTALTRLAEFIGIATGIQATLTRDEAATVARYEVDHGHATHVDAIVVDIGLGVIHRFASWLIKQQIRLQSLELAHPVTPYADDYPTMFGTYPSFDAVRSALVFDDKYLRLPIVRSEAELRQFIRDSPADIFTRREYVTTTSQRVRQILERNEPGAFLTADKVAARLALSTQHLRRLLNEEGSSFRAIQEQILRDRAIESLARGDETIEALARRLGYSEPSAFRRAFRRWTGAPPGTYIAASRKPG